MSGKHTSESLESERMENVRVGYQTAVQLWAHEGNVNWASFNVMIIANSVFVATLGLILTNEDSSIMTGIVLSILGLTVCGAWYLISKRGFDLQEYFVMSARELEEKFLAPEVQTSSRGGTFTDGGQISVEISGKQKLLKMSLWGRILRARSILRIVILVFAVVYILALTQLIISTNNSGIN